MKKRIMAMATTLALSAFIAGCSGSSSSKGESEGALTLKLAHSGSDTHQYQIGAAEFAKVVEEKSDGKIKVEIHGNATLGSEAEAIEQVIDGTIDMSVVAADSSLANTVPEMNLFGLPYIFDDREHVYSKLDGEPGKELLGLIDQNNMKGLGYWEVGFRHLTNNKKEINKPQDVEGLKIRVQPAPVWETHMKALGANPTPVAFNELYSALDQGVVDGQENPLPTIHSMKFYEVQKYVALTGHTYTPAVVIMSNNSWGKLDEDQQKVIEEAVEETKEYQRNFLEEKEQEIIAELKENGVTISEPDREAFKEATKDVKNALADQVPAELISEMESK
ncbi:TRAP transporter substrate-binding protein [Cytobacillus sp. NCCP-133]|uniref:TRAP transporter substrate-binding protein n=1 Tax=Cytobacillus sp. NCCP-133 TaxID=766848 RepID=UPI00222F4CA9|nr:DctP family TRAP transporter solute-binding subunit [Cytobacillus sp. NCCP-133]GLB60293.1 ABC transporter substrate-binding protein [Cytobacillus sp. NCCP-133]